MAVRIQVRRDTSDNWQEANPVLASGEIGYITDLRMAKVGNGSDPFNTLQFLVGGNEAQIIALINQNTASISSEAQTRASADATLQSNINAEAAARAEGDNELSGRILALETADPDVPPDLVQQVETNTEAIAGLVTNDENLADAINGKLGLPQGELTELNINDWLIIGRTDPNTGTTPTYLSRLSTLKEEIGDGGGTGPAPTTVLNWNFAGVTFFQAPPGGGIGVNPSGSTIYVSKTNAAGQDISTEFLNEFRAGNLFSLQVPARTNGDTGDTTQFMQFSIQQNPVNQGTWWNVATSRIIDANSQNPWEVGESLDAVVQVAPTTRTLITDPETQPEDVITHPAVLVKWNTWKAEQDWEEDYTPTQADVNKFFIQMDQTQESEILALTDRVTALESAPGGGIEEAPIDGEQYARKDATWEVVDVEAPMHLEFEWKGEEWWPDKVKEGEMFGHKSEDNLFFSEVDENGLNTKTIMNGIVKAGTTIFVTKTKDRSRWAHFTARGAVADTGSFLTLGVNLNAKSEKEIKDDDDVTVMFNVTAPVEIPSMIKAEKVLELEDLLGKMKKELTALKGQVTRLKNGK